MESPQFYHDEIPTRAQRSYARRAMLSGAQHKELADALVVAFPTENQLRRMVDYQLNKNLDVISEGGTSSTEYSR